MKSYRNAIATLILAVAFSTPAFADDGVMWTGIASPPPPPPPSVQAEGVMWTGIAAPAPEADAITEIAVNLLQNLLTLL